MVPGQSHRLSPGAPHFLYFCVKCLLSSLLMETTKETELCFPEFLNTSCRKPKHTYSEAVLIYIVMPVTSVVTVILNLLVIVSISHFKQLHTATNFLILSLAFSDFIVGVLMCFHIFITDGCWALGDIVCVAFSVFDFTGTSASVGTMVLISIDRYVAICEPLHYSSKITVTKVTVCICLCWVFSFLYNCLLIHDNLDQLDRYISCFGECIIVVDHIAGVADIIITFFAPVTVIIVLYMRVFMVAVSQARAMRSHITSVTHSRTMFAKKSELKAARTLGVVIVVFLTCLCPYFISSLVGESSLFTVSSVPLQNWLLSFNSCLNPIIYAFCSPWYRKSVKLIFTFKILEPDSCEANVF
ncbi:trace amine-associated receptor 13c-like [Antennarius striatus]|uniref:trace amine-associated receptor 13c-like n=1 Tax=Antennarius striatus TaxID=241820 RepID=UPI0035AEE7C4